MTELGNAKAANADFDPLVAADPGRRYPRIDPVAEPVVAFVDRLDDGGLVGGAFDFHLVEAGEAGFHAGQRLLQQVLNTAVHRPSPMSAFDAFFHLALIVTVLAVISTYLCRRYVLVADFPLTLLATAVVFPIERLVREKTALSRALHRGESDADDRG